MDFENILNQLLMNSNTRGENVKGENVKGENVKGENVRGMEEKMQAEEKMRAEEKMQAEAKENAEAKAKEENMVQAEEMKKKAPEKSYVRGAEMGDLPCDAPVAMTYTPMQRSGTPKFTAGEALDRGTLWPGLELPWKNNFAVRNVANTPLGELQALDFALVELALYLDTHPKDADAFMLFKRYAKAYQDKKAAYVKMFGPIEKAHAAEADRWTWIDDPWPWDYSERR